MTTIEGPCVMCGAKPGEPCTSIGGDDETDLKPGDPRPEPHFYRSTNPNDPQPAVAVKDEPPYYLDTPEDRARYERAGRRDTKHTVTLNVDGSKKYEVAI